MEQAVMDRLKVGLELMVNSVTPESATIEVGWCVLPGVLEHLREREAVSPHVLLVITDEQGNERRQLEPLERGLAYVSFRAPGRNTIQAKIVWDPDGLGRLKDSFLSRERGKYQTTVLSASSGELVGNAWTLGYSKIQVTVDRKCFAAKPPAWLARWINFWFETEPVDECAFRRRAILAFTLQPLTLALYYPLKLAIMLFIGLWYTVMLGRGGINYRALWPLAGAELSELVTREAGLERSFWFHLWRWQFSPPFLTIVTLLMLFVKSVSEDPKTHKHIEILFRTFGQYLQYLAVIIVAAYALTVLVSVLVGLIGSIPVVQQRLKERRREAARKQALAEVQQIETAMGYLVCTGDVPRPVSFRNLPPQQRTFDLRFKELKARVCRPFAV
ncbi:MAG: hypothetical protein AAB402_05365 [Patescibacteria group bacterium]